MAKTPWLWLVATVAFSVVCLTIGTLLAFHLDQDVSWYTGVGQWLGAIASVVAAGVALWIATSDRKRADQLRRDEQRERDADALREAGLVRVHIDDLPRRDVAGVSHGEYGVEVRNRRSTRIFDLDVEPTRDGEVIPVSWCSVEIDFKRASNDPADCVVQPDQVLHAFISIDSWRDVQVTVRYTDQSGRRWRVGTDGAVAKVGTA